MDSQVEHRSRLETRMLKVRDIVDQYRSGHIVIPEFQREYVWKPKQAVRLVESLYRKLPVSSLLSWSSDAQVQARRPQTRALLDRTVSWLIDGQQRVITLYRLYKGEEGIDVAFNPSEEKFRLTSATLRSNSSWFRVSDIWNEKKYREIRQRLLDDPRSQMWEPKLERLRLILDYEIPTVMMIDHPFEDAADAFERINTLGVKLKKGEVQSARVAARHTGFIAEEIIPFISKLHDRGFARLDARHLFRTCSFIAVPDGRIRTPIHELTSPQLKQAWTRTKRAVEETISLVRGEFGLTNMDILWSGTLLVPLIVLCDSRLKSAQDRQAIAGWLALASLFHRYFRGTDGLDQDLKACRADDPIGKLLANVRRDSRGLRVFPDDFRGKSSDKGALFAVYAACRHRGLCDLFTGAPVSAPGRVESQYMLARAHFSPGKRTSADTLANVGFVDGESTRPGGSTAPEVYLARLKGAAITSQCIPTNQDLGCVEKADLFWEERRTLLADAFSSFLHAKLGKRMG